ncbi:unnamed protein product [Pleuronectes platessa]|uniref:Uncharacterized protein n=1 Tax=Pleuronectes platessa TaxID=8262 RepID=A0A9N7YYV6_PLEPL|nr:unnamed protein product [Pleuronectes platessa]
MCAADYKQRKICHKATAQRQQLSRGGSQPPTTLVNSQLPVSAPAPAATHVFPMISADGTRSLGSEPRSGVTPPGPESSLLDRAHHTSSLGEDAGALEVVKVWSSARECDPRANTAHVESNSRACERRHQLKLFSFQMGHFT